MRGPVLAAGVGGLFVGGILGSDGGGGGSLGDGGGASVHDLYIIHSIDLSSHPEAFHQIDLMRAATINWGWSEWIVGELFHRFSNRIKIAVKKNSEHVHVDFDLK